MPDIQFINSPRNEAERVINTLIVIMSGFYEKHGFVVVERLEEGVDSESAVVLPRLDYSSIPGLWEELRSCESWIPTKIDGVWVERVVEIMGGNLQDSPGLADARLNISADSRDLLSGRDLGKPGAELWGRVQEQFFDGLEQYFPKVKELIGEIEVRITKYGTVSSGSWLTGEKKQKVIFYLREDRGIEDIASMFINLLMHLEKDDLGITWSKREALMDFIMTRPNMKKLFPKFRPVMSQLSRVSASVRKQSEKYLRELEMPTVKKEFEIQKMPLSKLEKKVMKQLVEHQGELVTYDELADNVWGVGEFKTFWAINKLVERMRIKLEKLGIDSKRIESVRGQGYLLR